LGGGGSGGGGVVDAGELLGTDTSKQLSAIRSLIRSASENERVELIRSLSRKSHPDVKLILIELLKRDPSRLVRWTGAMGAVAGFTIRI
jgi:HEAT repeat protein